MFWHWWFLLNGCANINHNEWVCNAFNRQINKTDIQQDFHRRQNLRTFYASSLKSSFVRFVAYFSLMFLQNRLHELKKKKQSCRNVEPVVSAGAVQPSVLHSLQTRKPCRRWRWGWLAPVLRRLQEVQLVKLQMSSHLIRE